MSRIGHSWSGLEPEGICEGWSWRVGPGGGGGVRLEPGGGAGIRVGGGGWS